MSNLVDKIRERNLEHSVDPERILKAFSNSEEIEKGGKHKPEGSIYTRPDGRKFIKRGGKWVYYSEKKDETKKEEEGEKKIFKIKNDNDIPISFRNLKGKDLKSIGTKTVHFASGNQTYYTFEVDGEKYEVPERFLDESKLDTGKTSEEKKDDYKKNLSPEEGKVHNNRGIRNNW